MFLRTIEPTEAEGEVASIYVDELASMGRVMQATQCWSARPDILAPVDRLLHQIRDGFSLGLINFRLITLVVAKHVPVIAVPVQSRNAIGPASRLDSEHLCR